jgi:hypothetical protein
MWLSYKNEAAINTIPQMQPNTDIWHSKRSTCKRSHKHVKITSQKLPPDSQGVPTMVPTAFVEGLGLRNRRIPDQQIKTLGSHASPHAQQVSGSIPGPLPMSHLF